MRNSSVPQELHNLGVRNMNTVVLNLSRKNLTNLPSSIGKLKKLEELILTDNDLTSIPPQIGNLKKLDRLFLGDNYLTSLPSSIGNLKNLMYIDSGGNLLNSLPESIFKLKRLEELKLSQNNLKSVPRQIGNLKNLKVLGLAANKLTSIPKEIGKLKKLDVLFLGYNKLTSLPDEIGRLPNLTAIYIHSNPNLRIIPKSLRRSGLSITKSSWTRYENMPLRPVQVQRRNVPLNTNRNDPISGYIFRVGNNALNLGYNKYVTENSLLNWIKTKNNKTNITNIKTLYSLSPNTNIVSNPFTRQPLFRRNLNFVKFVKSNKPNTPNTLAKNLNKTKINNKPKTPNNQNTPKPTRKRAGNATQNRRTNRN